MFFGNHQCQKIQVGIPRGAEEDLVGILECSVMSEKFLGKNFDFHGGGLDLVFPHHENEIAQSCCANKIDKFANYWLHNGYVTFNKEKDVKIFRKYYYY